MNHVVESSGDEGFDAITETYGNLPDRGIIDPTKVVVTALTNATSIATMVLSTEAPIADAPETVNADPYGEGWLLRVRLTDPSEVDSLLDAEAYRQFLADQG